MSNDTWNISADWVQTSWHYAPWRWFPVGAIRGLLNNVLLMGRWRSMWGQHPSYGLCVSLDKGSLLVAVMKHADAQRAQ